jgi:hypothetical protein
MNQYDNKTFTRIRQDEANIEKLLLVIYKVPITGKNSAVIGNIMEKF